MNYYKQTKSMFHTEDLPVIMRELPAKYDESRTMWQERVHLTLCKRKLADCEAKGIPACIARSERLERGKVIATYDVWQEGIEARDEGREQPNEFRGEVVQECCGWSQKMKVNK